MMSKFFDGLTREKVANTTRGVLENKFFPAVTALVLLVCYYLSLDIVSVWYYGIVCILMLILLDDLTPLICHFPYVHVFISYKNSPSSIAGNSNFYTSPVNYVQFLFLIAVVIGLLIYRLVRSAKQNRVKLSPVFFALCALSASFLLNGLFSEKYMIMDTVYGVALSFVFLFIYVVLSANVVIKKENYNKIATSFVILSAMILFELVVLYLFNPNVIVNGQIDKEQIVFGWGIWNSIGMLFCLCIPFVFLLGAQSKRGYLWILYATVLMVATVFTTSRQAILSGAIVYVASLIVLLVKVKDRRNNLITTGALVLVALVVGAIFFDKVISLFGELFNNLFNSEGQFTGNGRMHHIIRAFEDFLSNPAFGVGFFGYTEDAYFVGLDGIVPIMYCNTFAQMAGACGIVGLASYVFYRVQTAIHFFKKPTLQRTFCALSVVALLITNLFDNHIFYMLITFAYGGLSIFAMDGESLGVKTEDEVLEN